MSRRSSHLLIPCVAVLLTVGVVMLFSASAYQPDNRGDIYLFLRKQCGWLGLGLVACAVAAWVDYRFWDRVRWPLFVVSLVLLALCFVPGVGLRLNGSPRWVRFGPVSFQPSDLAKLAAVVLVAAWSARRQGRNQEFLTGLVLPASLVALLMAAILAEKDLGTTVLIGTVAMMTLFVAGCRVVYVLLAGGLGGGSVFYLATHIGNRKGRMLAFLDLEKYKDTFGLQQWEALKAFAMGGVTGQGLGESVEKMRYLPYAHTDFIFPIVGEELGLRVTLLVVLAFALIAVSGILIATSARDRFGLLLAFGLTMTLVLQAAVNIGVTTALLPNKGMPLPFISSGGSNLCLCLLFVGILLNVHRHGGRTAPARLRDREGGSSGTVQTVTDADDEGNSPAGEGTRSRRPAAALATGAGSGGSGGFRLAARIGSLIAPNRKKKKRAPARRVPPARRARSETPRPR